MISAWSPDPSISRERSLGAGAATVAVAAGLLALDRFGGLAVTAPRAFLRLALWVVWGWIGVSVVIWALTAVVVRTRPDGVGLGRVLARTGRAHMPLIGLALVLLLAANALQLRWPGLLAAIGVFGWWFPRALLDVADHALPLRQRLMIVAPAYAAWLVTVGRHLADRLGHLI